MQTGAVMNRLPPRNNRKCSVEGCENRGDIRKGLCNAHYRRWKRHGDPLGGCDSTDTREVSKRNTFEN